MSKPHFEYDLSAYAARIGYAGPLEPTLEVLQALAWHHVTSIPFEAFNVWLSRGISLEPEHLQQKLITDRRGGYCFEQNGMMLDILRQIGFDVKPLSGRVRLDLSRDVLPPRTHLFLQVMIEGEPWIFDAGVGGMSLTEPIRNVVDVVQETKHETRRIVFEEGRFFHQAQHGRHWVDVYEFTGEEMAPIDRELGNWWTSTHPKSKFKLNTMAALARPEGVRLGYMNGRFTRRRGSELLEDIHLASDAQLEELLTREFGIEVSLADAPAIRKPV